MAVPLFSLLFWRRRRAHRYVQLTNRNRGMSNKRTIVSRCPASSARIRRGVSGVPDHSDAMHGTRVKLHTIMALAGGASICFGSVFLPFFTSHFATVFPATTSKCSVLSTSSAAMHPGFFSNFSYSSDAAPKLENQAEKLANFLGLQTDFQNIPYVIMSSIRLILSWAVFSAGRRRRSGSVNKCIRPAYASITRAGLVRWVASRYIYNTIFQFCAGIAPTMFTGAFLRRWFRYVRLRFSGVPVFPLSL